MSCFRCLVLSVNRHANRRANRRANREAGDIKRARAGTLAGKMLADWRFGGLGAGPVSGILVFSGVGPVLFFSTLAPSCLSSSGPTMLFRRWPRLVFPTLAQTICYRRWPRLVVLSLAPACFCNVGPILFFQRLAPTDYMVVQAYCSGARLVFPTLALDSCLFSRRWPILFFRRWPLGPNLVFPTLAPAKSHFT